jgi:hypothetical protein
VNELKIDPIVVGMTGRALFAGSIRFDPHRMHAAPLGYSFANFRVAFQAFQFRGTPAEVMALGAICGTGERLMSLGKRTWRDLRVGGPPAKRSRQAQ